jgi:hypothetical protein
MRTRPFPCFRPTLLLPWPFDRPSLPSFFPVRWTAWKFFRRRDLTERLPFDETLRTVMAKRSNVSVPDLQEPWWPKVHNADLRTTQLSLLSAHNALRRTLRAVSSAMTGRRRREPGDWALWNAALSRRWVHNARLGATSASGYSIRWIGPVLHAAHNFSSHRTQSEYADIEAANCPIVRPLAFVCFCLPCSPFMFYILVLSCPGFWNRLYSPGPTILLIFRCYHT